MRKAKDDAIRHLESLRSQSQPNPNYPPESESRRQKRLQHDRGIVRAVLPRLLQEIENPNRDMNSVFEALKPYHHETRGNVPSTRYALGCISCPLLAFEV